MRTESRTIAVAACAAPFVVFAAVYLPAAGHGFISDDFGWLMHNRIRGAADFRRILLSDNGFYRPVVAFSFAANELVFGLSPRGYGLTNVMLAALCGGLVYALCRALTLPRGAAAFGSALWLLNPHGINMSILWISGRTALLATAAALGCTVALLRGRHALAGILLTIAVFSREDAALLPLVTGGWLYLLQQDRGDPHVRAWKWLLIGGAIVAAYFAIRSTTNAMTPANAPAYYRFTLDPVVLLRNAGEYADRTSTFTLGALLILFAVLRPGLRALDVRARTIAICGVVWTGVFLLPALLLPVRSSLYACLPSAGACVAASAVAARWWSAAMPPRPRHALICAVVLPLLLWPVYHARTSRWVGMAEFSTRALADLEAALKPFPDDSDILIVDDRSTRANMASVFSTLLRDAFQVTSGRFMTFHVVPPIPNASPESGGESACNGCEDLRLVVTGGRLTPSVPRR